MKVNMEEKRMQEFLEYTPGDIFEDLINHRFYLLTGFDNEYHLVSLSGDDGDTYTKYYGVNDKIDKMTLNEWVDTCLEDNVRYAKENYMLTLERV